MNTDTFPGNKKLKYIPWAVIGLFTLFLGISWVAGTTINKTESQPDQTKQVKKTERNTTQAIKPIVLAKVIAVIDGDTIDVDLGQGNIKRVRYIGIDTPESVDPRKPVQCFSKEATAKNKQMVENGIVRLEEDVSETDKFQRLLRYVYIGDLFINYMLVAEGYATAVSYPPDIKYQDKLNQAEQQARVANKGLWRSCGTNI